MIAAVVLAAGAGRRLGGRNKALLEVAGVTLLDRIAAAARAAGVGPLVVVYGPPHGAATAAEAARLGLRVALNPDPERGMGSSVAAGFAALAAADAAAALLWPVDHAWVAPATLAALVGAAGPERWVVPCHRDAAGHPVAIGRALWAELASCGTLPGGARAVRDRHAAAVVRLAVDDPGVLRDVDDPADLREEP